MTKQSQNTGGKTNDNDEYKDATKAVVDDMFRDDVLGPRICSVLENHTPASSKVKDILAEAISSHPACRSAIESVLTDLNIKRKGRWMDIGLGAIGTIVIAIIIWFVQKEITTSITSPAQQPVTQETSTNQSAKNTL